MLANGVKETTTTTGTGTVTLAAVTGFPRFSQVLSVGQYVDYAIQDGNNWEWGVGKVAASNTLERTLVTAKFDSGAYSKNPVAPLSLSGSATVFCAITDATNGICNNGPHAEQFVVSAHIVQTGAFLNNRNYALANRLYFFPWVWPPGVDRVAKGVRVSKAAAGTATKMRVGIVQYGATQYGHKLLTQTSDIALTTSGVKVASFPAPIALPLAAYGLAVLFDGSATMLSADSHLPGLRRTESADMYGSVQVATGGAAGWTEINEVDVNGFVSNQNVTDQLFVEFQRP